MNAPVHPVPPGEWPALPEPGMIDEILDVISRGAKISRGALLPGTTMQSLDIASLDMVEILFELEETFEVYIAMSDELSEAVYLRDLVQVLANEMHERAGAEGTRP